MKNFGKTTDIKDIITVEYEADNAVLYSTSQSLTNNQKAQARTNIGAGTSSFDGNYNSLSNKPTIPTKTSQLNNDSNFATTSQVEAKYTKPASGIPKTDLATAVQNSLTAADNAVKYTSQSLTDAQKVQARTNIGAGTSNFSGSYNDLTNRPSIPAAVSIVQSTGTSTSSVMSQKATTDAVNGKLSKTDNTNIEVLGTKKATTTLGGNQLYAPNGVIFGGSAAAAGLVTRGICGVSTPSVGGACTKENLYINYDGNNDFNAGRQIVLNAGTTGSHLGSNMYQYTVPRGDIVKNWVEAKGYATSVKVNGNTIASSGGVVDIGTVLTDASKFATSAQGTKADNAMPKSGGTFTGNVSLPKELVFTDNTNPFIKMTTGGTDFYFQSTSGQFGLGPTWDKATHWDSNGNVTFPTTPKVGSSSLALKTDIPPKVTESTVSGWGFTKNEGTVTKVKINGAEKSPSSGIIDLGTVVTAHQDISGKANLNGGNSWTGNQQFNNGSYYFATASDRYLTVEDETGNAYISMNSSGLDLDADELGNTQFMIAGNPGTSGQVLTSQGAGKAPIWGDIAKHGYTELTNEDLNTILTPGWYRAARNHSCKNIPIASRNEFILIVESSSPDYIQQTFYVLGILSQYYIRYTNNGGTSWPGARWYTYQLVGTAAEAFSGRKTFSNGINLNSSLQVNGSNGTAGQVLTSTGSGTPEWKTPSVSDSSTKTYSDHIYADDITTIFGNNEYGNAFIFASSDSGQDSRQTYSIYVNGVKTDILTSDPATDYVDQAVCINISRINGSTSYSFINVNVFYKNTLKTIHINDVSDSTVDLMYTDDENQTSSLYLNITKGTT